MSTTTKSTFSITVQQKINGILMQVMYRGIGILETGITDDNGALPDVVDFENLEFVVLNAGQKPQASNFQLCGLTDKEMKSEFLPGEEDNLYNVIISAAREAAEIKGRLEAKAQDAFEVSGTDFWAMIAGEKELYAHAE